MVSQSNMYVPTAAEFKKIFNLDDGYKIPRATLKQYAKYVIGSYLLYQELYDMRKKKPMIIKIEGKNEKIVCITKDKDWRTFIYPLGDRMTLECYYETEGDDRPTPFWTYTKFKEVRVAARLVYHHLENVLYKMQNNYRRKYGIHLIWTTYFKQNGFRGSTDLMTPVYIDGCDFKLELEIRKSDGMSQYIGNYLIKQSIVQMYDFQYTRGRHPIITKILNSK